MREADPARQPPRSDGAGSRPPVRRFRLGRPRLGCLGSLIVAVLFVLAFELLFNPWAFHLGDRFTPLTVWEGVGILHGSNGARDAVYVRLWLKARGMTSSLHSTRTRGTFVGEALVGTPQGKTQRYEVSGTLETTWWSADGVPLALRIRAPRGEHPRQLFDLHGSFRGAQLVLDDHGSSGRLFRPDGSVDPASGQLHSTAEHPWVRVALDHGTRADFEALARGLATGSPSRGP